MPTKVSVVKCNSYNQKEVDKAVKKAISLAGGINIKKASKVLLKPNILGNHKPEDYVTTHPAVVDAVCKLLKNKKLKLIIGDSSGAFVKEGTKTCLKNSGMEKTAKKYKAELMPLESKSKLIKNKNFKVLEKINISSIPLEADYIINIPKLKTHTLVKYTGAVKNMYGTIPGGNKSAYHRLAPGEEEFSDLLLDIYQNVIPQFNIMDGIYGIEGNGPGSGGIIKKAGIILASKDAVALDIVASGIIGFNPLDIKTNKFAIKRKLFDGKVELLGEKDISVKFKHPFSIKGYIPSFITKFFLKNITPYPQINNAKCRLCMTCVKACPAKTIKIKKKYPFIYRENCINCYCCHELCPYNAINLKSHPVLETLSKIKKKLKL